MTQIQTVSNDVKKISKPKVEFFLNLDSYLKFALLISGTRSFDLLQLTGFTSGQLLRIRLVAGKCNFTLKSVDFLISSSGQRNFFMEKLRNALENLLFVNKMSAPMVFSCFVYQSNRCLP